MATKASLSFVQQYRTLYNASSASAEMFLGDLLEKTFNALSW
ncbi:MAG: hypothetical protein AABW64_01505 [Nanoarchaeota archaeon]